MSASRILSRLRHKGQITEEEYRKLMNIKNSERHTQKVIEDIRAEIEQAFAYVENGDTRYGFQICLNIIDKHIKGDRNEKDR